MKPRLFVGSSSQKRLYALALQNEIRSSADVTVWNQGFFQLNKSYLIKGIRFPTRFHRLRGPAPATSGYVKVFDFAKVGDTNV
jgi:hypothetical protein